MNPFRSHLEEATPEEMLRTIERKDSMFRLVQTIFFVLVLSALAIVMTLTYRTLNDQKKEIDSLQQHIDCIVTLFGRPNRTTLSITNIHNCTIQTNE